MSLRRYRAVQRKVRRKHGAERSIELIRIIKAGDKANSAAYERLRNSGLNEEMADGILSSCHTRKSAAVAVEDTRSA
jgi:hypothetical protein